MNYSCQAFYIGKAKRPFDVRVGEHIKAIKRGDEYAPLARHFTKCHNKIPHMARFYSLDHILYT